MVTDVSEKPAFIFNVEVLQALLLVLFIRRSDVISFSTCKEFSFSGSFFSHLPECKNAIFIVFKHSNPLLYMSIRTEICSSIDKSNKLLLSSTPVDITIFE